MNQLTLLEAITISDFDIFLLSLSEPHQLVRASHQRHASRLPQVFEPRNTSRDRHPDPRFNFESNQVKRLVSFNSSENLSVASSVADPSPIRLVESSPKVPGRTGPSLFGGSEQRFRADRRLRKRRVLSFTDLGFGG